MRTAITALVLVASTFSASLAFATPPTAPVQATPVHVQSTPPNPDKVVRPVTPAVKTTPTVTYHTAALAEKHDQVKADPSKPIPAKLRIAKQEVLERNQTVTVARTQFRAESTTIEGQAHAQAHPTEPVRVYSTGPKSYVRNGVYVEDREIPATPEALAQASETYVSAAQLLVSKSGNLSQRVARENPDPGVKADSAKEIVVDYKKGASLYRLSADTEDRRADALTAQGKLPEAQIARDKAHNTRTVADKFDRKAAEIETNGIPGADAYTLPAEIKLSSKN